MAYEIELIIQKDDTLNLFQIEWKKYVKIILNYAHSHKTPTKDLRHALRDLTDFTTGEDDGKVLNIICNLISIIALTDMVTDTESLTCLRVLPSFLSVRSKKKDINPRVDVPQLLMEVVVSVFTVIKAQDNYSKW